MTHLTITLSPKRATVSDGGEPIRLRGYGPELVAALSRPSADSTGLLTRMIRAAQEHPDGPSTMSVTVTGTPGPIDRTALDHALRDLGIHPGKVPVSLEVPATDPLGDKFHKRRLNPFLAGIAVVILILAVVWVATGFEPHRSSSFEEVERPEWAEQQVPASILKDTDESCRIRELTPTGLPWLEDGASEEETVECPYLSATAADSIDIRFIDERGVADSLRELETTDDLGLSAPEGTLIRYEESGSGYQNVQMISGDTVVWYLFRETTPEVARGFLASHGY